MIYIEQIESDTFDWKSIKLAVIGKISFISKGYSRYLLYVKIELKWRKFPNEKKVNVVKKVEYFTKIQLNIS